MCECSVPQNSAHSSRYSPGRSALNQRDVYRPGRTSCLMRSAGRNRLWMTSCEIIVSLTGSPIGTCNSSISRCPPGCWNFHVHCLATTSITRAPEKEKRPAEVDDRKDAGADHREHG